MQSEQTSRAGATGGGGGGTAAHDWVTIAQLVKTRGNKGELAAISLSSHPERFAELGEVTLFGGEAFPSGSEPHTVESVWEHGARLIFKFAGVDSISDAERLRGADVRIPESERFPLPEGEFYHSDLVGCELVDAESGRTVGRVADFQEAGGGNGLLVVVETAGREPALVPFHRNLCPEIDVERKRIVVKLPAGLLELNG